MEARRRELITAISHDLRTRCRACARWWRQPTAGGRGPGEPAALRGRDAPAGDPVF